MHTANLSRIDLNLLVVFEAIAQTRSVTQAAERLSLSQPAISHALKRLRQLVGDPLFVRGREGLVPTPRAAQLLPAIAGALSAVGEALTTAPFDPATTERSFRIAASDYSMMTVLPRLTRSLRQRAPRATIQICHTGMETLAAMERDELDVSFWGADLPGGVFEAQELFRENYVGLMCARHPLAVKAVQGQLAADEFVAYPHVLATLRDARPSPIERALSAVGLRRHVGMVSPNFLANIASLPDTDLIMAAPSRLARFASNRTVVTFALPFDVPDYSYSIVWHGRASEDEAHRWLRREIVEASRARGRSARTGL